MILGQTTSLNIHFTFSVLKIAWASLKISSNILLSFFVHNCVDNPRLHVRVPLTCSVHLHTNTRLCMSRFCHISVFPRND